MLWVSKSRGQISSADCARIEYGRERSGPRQEISHRSMEIAFVDESSTGRVASHCIDSDGAVSPYVAALEALVALNVQSAPHLVNLSLPCCPSCTPGVFLAVGTQSSTGPAVQVLYHRKLHATPLLLETHLQRKPVTAVCLTRGSFGGWRGMFPLRSHTWSLFIRCV